MTLAEFKKVLDSSGIKFKYHHWEKPAPPLPYGVYLCNGAETFKADGQAYFKNDNIRIELYNNKKDVKVETQLENALDRAEIYYKKVDEIYLETEKMYQIIYELEL